MAHKKNNTNLTELLLQCVTQPDPKLIISADHFRCSLRVGFGDPGVLPRSLLAALQGAFHSEYPGLCTAEREEILCLRAEGNLVGSHCGTSQKAGL